MHLSMSSTECWPFLGLNVFNANFLNDSAAWNGSFPLPVDADRLFVTHLIDFVDHVAMWLSMAQVEKNRMSILYFDIYSQRNYLFVCNYHFN